METKTAHLITGTRADVEEALTRMIKDMHPEAEKVTFLDIPDWFDFRALADKPAAAQGAAKTAEKAPKKPGSYEDLKVLCVKAMDEIGRGRVMDILRLFNLRNLAEAEKNRILVMTLTALFQVIRFSHEESAVSEAEAKKAAQKILRAFDLAEGES